MKDHLERGRKRFRIFSRAFASVSGESLTGPLLDFGCGAGGFVAAAWERGFEAYGIDVTEDREKQFEQVSAAAGMPVSRLERYAGDVIPFPDGSFECVYSFFVLEHVPDSVAAVREIARVTRPGGWVCLFAEEALNGWEGHARIPWPPFMDRRYVRSYLREFGFEERTEFIESEVFYCSADQLADELRSLGFHVAYRNAAPVAAPHDGRDIDSEEEATRIALDLKRRFELGELGPPEENLVIYARKERSDWVDGAS